jgi:hypothetical protein
MGINKKSISNILIVLTQLLILSQFLVYFQTKYNSDNPLLPREQIIFSVMDIAATKGTIASGLLTIGLVFYFYKKYMITIILNGLAILGFLFSQYFI